MKKRPNVKPITVKITGTALLKIIGLMQSFEGEVGWHGIVRRKHETLFEIEDIIVYPQVATNASVDTNQYEYESWLMELDDACFDKLRMHGHSHVNFAVSPSAKDGRHRAAIVEKLHGDMFYIFMIFNKSFDLHVLLYDYNSKTIFSSDGILIYVVVNGLTCKYNSRVVAKCEWKCNRAITAFLQEAKSIVQTPYEG